MHTTKRTTLTLALLSAVNVLSAHYALADDDVTPTQTVAVTGHYDNAVGTSDAASQGTITSDLVANRPALRTGECSNSFPA